MKPEQINKFITEIEEKFPVDRWEIDRIHFWPMLRIQLMIEMDDYIIKQKEQQKNNLPGIGIVKNLHQIAYGLPKYWYSYLKDHAHNDHPDHKAGTVFLSQSTNRMFSAYGKKYDIFCDPIVSFLKERNVSSFFIETPPNNQYRIPRHGKTMFIYPQHISWELKSRLNKEAPDFPELKTFQEFNQFLDLSGHYPGGIGTKSLYKKIRLLRLRADWFKKLFETINPWAGLQVEYYSSLGLAFNLACHEYGIPSVDIQHGVENHAAYIQWKKLPRKGYSLLPNFFWVWGEEEENFINEWNTHVADFHRPLRGGNILLDTFQDDNADIVKYFDQQINTIIKEKDIKFNILVTLQPDRTIPAMVIKAMETMPESYFWWIRLHPGMPPSDRQKTKKELSSLVKNNWDLDNASRLPLYSLLRKTNLHITAFSSCVIEAAKFGVPSIITEQSGVDYFEKYISRKEAFASLTFNDLFNIIEMIKNQNYKITNLTADNKSRLYDVFKQLESTVKKRPNVT